MLGGKSASAAASTAIGWPELTDFLLEVSGTGPEEPRRQGVGIGTAAENANGTYGR
jgi:hypothetical protein